MLSEKNNRFNGSGNEYDRVTPIIGISDHRYLELRKDLYKISQKYSHNKEKTWHDVQQTAKEYREDAIKNLFCKNLSSTANDIFNKMRDSRKKFPRFPYMKFSLIDPEIVYEAQQFIIKERKRKYD